jgi:hypothetical protein
MPTASLKKLGCDLGWLKTDEAAGRETVIPECCVEERGALSPIETITAAGANKAPMRFTSRTAYARHPP